jgi:hypothetical protein
MNKIEAGNRFFYCLRYIRQSVSRTLIHLHWFIHTQQKLQKGEKEIKEK